jgi:hypothetical protein
VAPDRGRGPRAPITRTLPANQAWIARAAARFDVEAWLAPRRVELVAGGQRFCEVLGRPPVRCEDLEREAQIWSARRSEDAEAVLGDLSKFNRWDVGTFEPELGRWLLDRLGPAEALRRGGDRICVVNAVLDRAFEESPARMLAVLAKLQGLQWQTWNHAWGLR